MSEETTVKLTSDELSELRRLHSENEDRLKKVAYNEMDIDTLTKQKPTLLLNADNSYQTLDRYKKDLSEKYGDGSNIRIDYSNGNIIKINV